MSKRNVGVIACCIAAVLLVGNVFSNSRTDDALGIAVSPQTLILGFEQGGEVKVHTAIPLNSVDRSTVTLNGIPACGIGVDALGHIVGIFNESEVKAIVAPPAAVLTFAGSYVSGKSFSGSDRVQVIIDPRPID
jgi:hypothetical protein